MKRFATILLALVMILSLAVPAFAAEITIENAKDGETYTAYKIFDVTISGENYAYTIEADSPWVDVIKGFTYGEPAVAVFTLTASSSDPSVLVVTENVDDDYGAELAAYLDANIPEGATGISAKAEEGKVDFEGLDAGYYFVDTTLGSLCSLFTYDSSVALKEKNTIPSLTKTQSDNALQIGEEVTYTITVTDAKGTDAAITVHDKMEAGLTLDADSFAIKVNGVDVDEANYTITTEDLTDGCTFEIEFTAAYVASLEANAQVVITYNAKLDKDAEIAPATNDNTAWLTYSEQTTKEVTVQLYSYEFDLDKVDGEGNALTGAKFELYDVENDGEPIKVVGTAGNYRVAEEGEEGVTEMETDANGQLTIIGLDNKAYWLEETEAPIGYNILTARVKVDLANGNLVREDDKNIDVVNQSGSELPTTGGVGTTMFYLFGGVMVLAAVVLLVTKKRMTNVE